MKLADRFARLADAILFQVETAEDAIRLRPLDDLLHPWIRAEIESLERSLDWCDSARDLESAVSGLVRTGHDYAELRHSLFVDLHNFAPEPPWRVVGSRHKPQFAVRAQPTFLAARPTYALRNTGSGADGAEDWEFSVIDDNNATEPVVHRITLRDERPFPTAVAPAALWAEKEHCLQLYYGFEAMGRSPHLRGTGAE